MKRVVLIGLAVGLFLTSTSFGDEGMWLYNAFPKAKLKAKYGFEPSQAWLDHVRLGSVRFNNGGSGSFVSSDGLTFTNHHVGAQCVQQISTSGHDYMKEGFYAKTHSEEAKCPDLELNVLIGIEDVTAKVNASVKPGGSAADTARAQRVAMSQIEKDCNSSTGLRCDVISFYSGEVYNLYKYKKYTDVRLVFAPEFDSAFFGGDPDNFTYPRYDLDITFFRVYEKDKPARIDHYLHWAKEGVKENELVFVSGNPGSTGRLRTLSQLDYLREVDYPSRLETYSRRIHLLLEFSSKNEENARIAKEEIFAYQNSFKAITGYLGGLTDQHIMAKKQADEEKLRATFLANPKNQGAANPWDGIAGAMKVQRDIYLPLTYVERLRGYNSDMAEDARLLVRAAAERNKPNDQRLREFRESNLASLEQSLFSTAPIYKSLETVTLADSLAQMRDALGADNPIVQKSLNGKTPFDAAQQVIADSRLNDASYRRQLYEGGASAMETCDDPLILLMRAIDPQARAVRKQYEDQVDAVERTDGATIARARFAESGFDQPPDATFTLRLSYGVVKGYTEDNKNIPYFTTLGGAYEHAEEHGNKPPFQLPSSWDHAMPKLKLSTPMDFVSTPDIIGGNSGSPTVNQAGEVVGIVFDGNIQSLVWNFAYDDQQARAVSVDSRGILEALRGVYGAQRLVRELVTGTHAAEISPAPLRPAGVPVVGAP
jgi:Peptidase S46